MRLDLSLINCHVRGLHSVVLRPSPRMTRIFFTTPNHEMFSPDHLAIHSHHCDLWLCPIYGEESIQNWTPSRGTHSSKRIFKGFKFDSAITGGGKFVPTGNDQEMSLSPTTLRKPLELLAYEYHTVTVAPGARSAWMVLERQEDPLYNPTCWSTQDLSQWTPNGLYQPMTPEFLKENFLRWKIMKEL